MSGPWVDQGIPGQGLVLWLDKTFVVLGESGQLRENNCDQKTDCDTPSSLPALSLHPPSLHDALAVGLCDLSLQEVDCGPAPRPVLSRVSCSRP